MLLGRSAESAVLQARFLAPFQTFRSFRPSARAAMHSASSVSHRRALTGTVTARLRTAPARIRKITGRIAVFQPSAALA
jgi:hypothetical protein